ncbi:hypothetical protein BJY04DRAFT_219819 [Aspergillus karnatakaensis]|uniref:uncharacterized protein n=1 Tax=Aspergillus karnatakaensis TaxID=1810916 RepID=UPI003CCD9197
MSLRSSSISSNLSPKKRNPPVDGGFDCPSSETRDSDGFRKAESMAPRSVQLKNLHNGFLEFAATLCISSRHRRGGEVPLWTLIQEHIIATAKECKLRVDETYDHGMLRLFSNYFARYPQSQMTKTHRSPSPGEEITRAPSPPCCADYETLLDLLADDSAIEAQATFSRRGKSHASFTDEDVNAIHALYRIAVLRKRALLNSRSRLCNGSVVHNESDLRKSDLNETDLKETNLKDTDPKETDLEETADPEGAASVASHNLEFEDRPMHIINEAYLGRKGRIWLSQCTRVGG